MHNSEPRYLSNIVTATLTGNADNVILGPNPRRTALLVSTGNANSSQFLFVNFGRPAFDGTNGTGLVVAYLGGPKEFNLKNTGDALMNEVHINPFVGAPGNVVVTILEVSCECDLRSSNPSYTD